MGVALVSLTALVLLASSRAIGSAVGALANPTSQLAGTDGRQAVQIPASSPALAPPSLSAPANPYTNLAIVTLSGILGAGFRPGSDVVRVYRQASPPIPIGEVPVGQLPQFLLRDVKLVPGVNEFTATVFGSGGETAASAPVRITYVTTKPRIVILAPSRGAKIATATVPVVGRVPVGASVVVRNLTNSTGSAVTADSHGSFSAIATLDPGTNAILVSVTDRAGNTNVSSLSLVRAASTRR